VFIISLRRHSLEVDVLERQNCKHHSLVKSIRRLTRVCDIRADGDLSARKALQNIAAGQQAENLLDFDDDDSTANTAINAPTGLAATAELANTPAAASLISGTSANPLDDLVSIFGSVGFSGSAPTSNPGSGMTSPIVGQPGGMNGLASLSFGATSPPPQQPQGSMGGLDGFDLMSPTAPNGGLPPATQSAPKQQQSQPQDDLLGLF
jgi:AP-1 complex subunit beta-1